MERKNIITRTVTIQGMTCVNCENKIERALKNTEGIVKVRVSYSKGNAVITYDTDLIKFDSIVNIIEKLDYRVVKSEKKLIKTTIEQSKCRTDKLQVTGIIVIILALYMIINQFGGFSVFNYFPVVQEGMGYGLLFVIGLLTSVHCVTMCGGINLSQCVPHSSAKLSNQKKLSDLRPSFLYNTGRVISYTIVGGIVGALGSVITFSGAGRGIVAIAAGVFMVIMGLNMLNIFPWLRRLNPRMPKILADKIDEQKQSKRPLYVGLLNGLMPCGPLQAMQLYALSTGDPVKGAISMLIFSIGTVPLMFGLGALSTVLTKKFTSRMMTVSAALVVVLGIFMFSSGMALSGFAIPSVSNALSNHRTSAETATAEIVNGKQTVTTTLNSGRYEPIAVQAGIPVEWNIRAESGSINGCNNRIVIPEYNIEKPLEPGDNIIKFTPEESGTVSYSCWMGMIRSEISVYDDINDKSQALPKGDASQLPGCCAFYGIKFL